MKKLFSPSIEKVVAAFKSLGSEFGGFVIDLGEVNRPGDITERVAQGFKVRSRLKKFGYIVRKTNSNHTIGGNDFLPGTRWIIVDEENNYLKYIDAHTLTGYTLKNGWVNLPPKLLLSFPIPMQSDYPQQEQRVIARLASEEGQSVLSVDTLGAGPNCTENPKSVHIKQGIQLKVGSWYVKYNGMVSFLAGQTLDGIFLDNQGFGHSQDKHNSGFYAKHRYGGTFQKEIPAPGKVYYGKDQPFLGVSKEPWYLVRKLERVKSPTGRFVSGELCTGKPTPKTKGAETVRDAQVEYTQTSFMKCINNFIKYNKPAGMEEPSVLSIDNDSITIVFPQPAEPEPPKIPEIDLKCVWIEEDPHSYHTKQRRKDGPAMLDYIKHLLTIGLLEDTQHHNRYYADAYAAGVFEAPHCKYVLKRPAYDPNVSIGGIELAPVGIGSLKLPKIEPLPTEPPRLCLQEFQKRVAESMKVPPDLFGG